MRARLPVRGWRARSRRGRFASLGSTFGESAHPRAAVNPEAHSSFWRHVFAFCRLTTAYLPARSASRALVDEGLFVTRFQPDGGSEKALALNSTEPAVLDKETVRTLLHWRCLWGLPDLRSSFVHAFLRGSR
jgi:hypothetical protein